MDFTMEKGTQIIYVPQHIDINQPSSELAKNPECELGFLSKDTHLEDAYTFCRYWSRYGNRKNLRTKVNSESTPIHRIIFSHQSAPQEVVDAWLIIIDYEQGENNRN